MSLIGAIRVVMGLDSAQYERSLSRARGRTQTDAAAMQRSYLRLTQSGIRAFSTLRTSIVAAGAAIAGSALFQQAKGALEWASSLSEAAQQVGLTVEQLQVLDLAAQQNGASVEGARRAVAFFMRTLGQAQAGVPAAVRAFQSIGITKAQLDGFRGFGDAFPRVAEGISRFTTAQEQAAAGSLFFGRAYREVAVIVNQGAAGWDRATQAAIRNGLVTEEQARKADEAADQFGMLASALRVQLLGAVIDALPGLISFGNALGYIIGVVIRLIGFIGDLIRAIGQLAAVRDITSLSEGLTQSLGTSVGLMRGGIGSGGSLLSMGITASRRQPGPRLNLGTSGRRGGGSNDAERQREQALRAEHDFDRQMRQQRMEQLRAQEEMTEDAIARLGIQSQIAALEREQRAKDLDLQLALKDITRERYDQLRAQYQLTASDQTQAEEAARQRQLREDAAALDDARYEAAAAALRSESDMAETAAERRRAELTLLDLTYRHQRAKLDAIINDTSVGRDQQAIDRAIIERAGLDAQYGLDRAGAIRDTRGPLESFLASIPRTAAQVNEALQSIAVEGLRNLTSGLAQSLMGVKSLGDAFKALKNIALNALSSILEMMLQRGLMSALSSLLPGFGGGGFGSNAGAMSLLKLPAFASGGSFMFGGQAGIDRNLLSLNGHPIARVSKGERGMILPAGKGGGSRSPVEVNIYADRSVVANDIEQMVIRGMQVAAQQGAVGGAALAQAQIRKRAGRTLGRR